MKKSRRYRTSHLLEDQYEPGSRGLVLKNLLGIKSKGEMDRIEAVAFKQTEDALFRMQTYGKHHRFSANDICKIHEIWLGNIYEWAGEYRQVKISKDGFPFAFPEWIPKLMEEFERNFLRRYTLRLFKDKNQAVEALARVHAELVLIHPFREGNGRVARLLSTLMVLQGGFPLLNFGPMEGRGTAQYIKAVHAGAEKNYSLMEDIFKKILRGSFPKGRKPEA